MTVSSRSSSKLPNPSSKKKNSSGAAPLSWMEEERANANERDVINISPPERVSEGRMAPPFLLSRIIDSEDSLISGA